MTYRLEIEGVLCNLILLILWIFDGEKHGLAMIGDVLSSLTVETPVLLDSDSCIDVIKTCAVELEKVDESGAQVWTYWIVR